MFKTLIIQNVKNPNYPRLQCTCHGGAVGLQQAAQAPQGRTCAIHQQGATSMGCVSMGLPVGRRKHACKQETVCFGSVASWVMGQLLGAMLLLYRAIIVLCYYSICYNGFCDRR